MKTLKEVVKEHNPEHINEKYKGGVYNCPDDYPYLLGHYPSAECVTKQTGEIDCDKCWMQPYWMTEEEKNDRKKIIEGLKIMKEMCKFNTGGYSICDTCDINDLCESITEDGEAETTPYFWELPEE